MIHYQNLSEVFGKGGSCISQLLAINHEIYSNIDACPSLQTRCVFLECGMKAYYINSISFNKILIKCFLANRFQEVVLNGPTSSCKEILAGVPQDSTL